MIKKKDRGHRLHLTNAGGSIARSVRLSSSAVKMQNVLMNYDGTFPIAECRPGETVTLVAVLEYGVPLPLPITLTWDDDSGRDRTRDLRVNVE